MSKLKIGLVLDDSLDKPDGVQQYVLNLGSWLHAQGHEVHYLVGATKRRDVSHIHSLSRNLNVRFNGNRMSMPLPTNHAALRKLLRAEAFDILHVQVPYSPWLAQRILLAARKVTPKTKIIGTFHIVPNSRVVAIANRALAIWTWRSLRCFDAMLAVSLAAQAFAKAAYKVDSVVVPNMVYVKRFTGAAPLPQFKRPPTILFLGRWVPRKGCIVLLQALDYLQTQQPELAFQAAICGKGELEHELKTYVREHGLGDKVTFVGFVEERDKPAYLASADIAVFPSSGGESFGIVLIEAMAAGHAVVLAGDNPGYRSVLQDRPELLFAPRDVPALAKLIHLYIQDVKRAEEVVRWQQDYVQQFDSETVGKRVLATYKGLIQP